MVKGFRAANEEKKSSNSPHYLPEVEDRKLFLGCLAAVLASRYDYDEDYEAAKGAEEAMELAGNNRNGNDDDDDDDADVNKKPAEAQQLQRDRHRKRRHEVLCDLLLSAGKLLQLEEENSAECFLPMLDRLLQPQPIIMHAVDEKEEVRAKEEEIAETDARNKAEVLKEKVDEIHCLGAFLEGLKPGVGTCCLAMFLLQHLLQGGKGYDARIRHSIKTLGVIILIRDCDDYDEKEIPLDVTTFATRKFESLEREIALKLIQLAQVSANMTEEEKLQLIAGKKDQSRKSRVMKGLKIGGAAVAAGTLFAMTAGMAAPAIAAGVAAVAGGTAITASAAALLTSTTAVTAIFGVGGGTLAAYKMKRRMVGLTEFDIIKESDDNQADDDQKKKTPDAELFSTICISGWLREPYDFQRPWGLDPTRPQIEDGVELLQRFYAIYGKEKIPEAEEIYKAYNGDHEKLFQDLREKHGSDPLTLFPLPSGPKTIAKLTKEQENMIEFLFCELGCNAIPPESAAQQKQTEESTKQSEPGKSTSETKTTPTRSVKKKSIKESVFKTNHLGEYVEFNDDKKIPKHITTAWDYKTTYGGELYTVHWESALISEISESVADLAVDLVLNKGATEALKMTVLSTLIAAVAWPVALGKAANLIDGPWTLAVERSDEAGKELARSLMIASGGNRPVTLVGFSFGARVVFSCLLELARYQEKWENYRMSNNGVKQESTNAEEDEEANFLANIREPASIVEDAIILGMPKRLHVPSWEACRQVVAGRLVHGFSQKDLILSLMFQIKRVGFSPVCGTCPINVTGVENVDLSEIVGGHQDYLYKMGKVLEYVQHGQPFETNVSSFIDSDFNANEVLQEVNKRDIKPEKQNKEDTE